ncbi:hypothetical protein ACJMK2_027709, partial [Sinanodonta woodiana]
MKELMIRTNNDLGGISKIEGTNQNNDILKINSTSAFLLGKSAEVSDVEQLIEEKYK